MAFQATMKKIRDDIDVKLSAYTIEHENQQNFTKPDNGLWIRATVKTAGSVTVCIAGKNTFRTPGFIDFQVFVPVGTDTETMDGAVEDIIQAYDYVDVIVGDAEGTVVKFDRAPDPTTLGRVGGQYQKNVPCPFYFDTLQT